ncbi:hypothetical protein 1 [Yongsan picorna-like virus 3]|uniref:hypothetical protein 1 n=1 Tax=Yongsan picorna-like virus 3 TaxID=2315806 RepID=UPI000EB686AE|nr:hypothetical protein 1 [Yongsan picorna-like virus 3]AXV43874.1 hypothetical protein 1 [Yongsan picorna-like virus 3]
MSYLKTTEEINTTYLVGHPTQEVETKDENMPILMTAPISSYLARGAPGYQQFGWVEYAAKEKDFATIEWPLTETNDIYLQIIKMSLFDHLFPIVNKAQLLFTFDYLVCKIMPTTNANFQGLARICYYPFPDDQFEKRNNITLKEPATRRVVSLDLTPTDTMPYIMKIPNNLPLHWYKIGDSYLMNYMLGKIVIQVISPLATKSALTKLTYTVRYYFEGFRTSANNVT